MSEKTILVFGATGRMGGAAARHLRAAGWHVRAISRNPESNASLALRSQGIDVVQGDMDNPAALRLAFKNAYGVFLVVNGWETGFAAEVRQGKHVADLAAESGIKHLVFAAAGTGERGTNIPHFDSKLDIEDYMNEKQVPLTIILPPPFMEMMTDKTFFPQVAMWNTKIKVLGENYAVPWIATDDIGGMAARIFAEPERYIGQRIKPVGDWKTAGQCRRIYESFAGKRPPRWPLPVWLVRRMQPELVKMWEWMRNDLSAKDLDLQPVSAIYGGATSVESFLRKELVGTS